MLFRIVLNGVQNVRRSRFLWNKEDIYKNKEAVTKYKYSNLLEIFPYVIQQGATLGELFTQDACKMKNST